VQPAWQQKQRIIVLSKADLYTELLPQAAWGESDKVREFLRARVRCPYYSLHPRVFAPRPPGVMYVAAASISSEVVLDAGGEVKQRPVPVSGPAGLDHLLRVLCDRIAWIEGAPRRRWRWLRQFVLGGVGAVLGLIAGGLVSCLIGLLACRLLGLGEDTVFLAGFVGACVGLVTGLRTGMKLG